MQRVAGGKEGGGQWHMYIVQARSFHLMESVVRASLLADFPLAKYIKNAFHLQNTWFEHVY